MALTFTRGGVDFGPVDGTRWSERCQRTTNTPNRRPAAAGVQCRAPPPMAWRVAGVTGCGVMVAPMAHPAPRGEWTLADGSKFRWSGRTLLVDVSNLELDPPARSLYINETAACLFPPVGVPGKPWRVSPATAVEIVARLNAARQTTGEPPVVLPRRFQRAARHVAAIDTMTMGGLPFPMVDAAGYPGRVNANQTLWVHRTTGAAVLEVDTTPAKFTPTESFTARPVKTYTRLGVRAAMAWLDQEGYPFRPAVLQRRRGAEDDQTAASD